VLALPVAPPWRLCFFGWLLTRAVADYRRICATIFANASKSSNMRRLSSCMAFFFVENDGWVKSRGRHL
jgi:hypothetical protein